MPLASPGGSAAAEGGALSAEERFLLAASAYAEAKHRMSWGKFSSKQELGEAARDKRKKKAEFMCAWHVWQRDLERPR